MAKCPCSRGDYVRVRKEELSTELYVHSDYHDLVGKVEKAARVHRMGLKLLGPLLRILSYFHFKCPFENSSGSLKNIG